MSEGILWLFCAALFAVSLLYSSVGQAGASGYIAALALFGFAPESIKPTALVLNVLVSVVVSWRFHHAGHLSWQLLWPFAVSSIPAALLGGYLTLPASVFNRLLGVLLIVAAVSLFFGRMSSAQTTSPPPLSLALLTGAGIGLLSGLTGVGGGVLITPVLLFCGWAEPRAAAALSAVFILVNSVAALAGCLSALPSVPAGLPLFGLAAIVGGAVGSQLGSVHLPATAIRRVLGVVLVLASVRLLFY